jgi:ABC-type multidrug transport system fused ATPase/permease subunit
VARNCYLPERLYLPFALASFVTLWSRRIRFLGVCVIAALLGNALVNSLVPHYLAPVLGAMMALHLQFLRWVRVWNPTALAALLLLMCGLLVHRYYHSAGAPPGFATTRMNMIHQLQADGRRHLVFVRYRPSHKVGDEWVFNGRDIPSQQVIWARSMPADEDSKLVGFARDRVAWVVDADDAHPTLRPWPSP